MNQLKQLLDDLRDTAETAQAQSALLLSAIASPALHEIAVAQAQLSATIGAALVKLATTATIELENEIDFQTVRPIRKAA